MAIARDDQRGNEASKARYQLSAILEVDVYQHAEQGAFAFAYGVEPRTAPRSRIFVFPSAHCWVQMIARTK